MAREKLIWPLCAALASVAFLAWAVFAMAGPMLATPSGQAKTYDVSVYSTDGRQSNLVVVAVDGHPLKLKTVPVGPKWTWVDKVGVWGLPGDRGPGGLRLEGHRISLVFEPPGTPDQVWVQCDGEPVESTVTKMRGGRMIRSIDAPTSEPSRWWAAALVTALGLALVLVGPWATARRAEIWLLAHAAILQLVYAWTHPIGANGDSRAYVAQAASLFSGNAGFRPPGYSALLALLGAEGTGFANVVTLAQAALACLASLWLFRILRESLVPTAAFFGALVAASLLPSLEMSRALLSEQLTCFTLIGALYFALVHRRTRRILPGLAAGVFAVIAGATRIVPIAVLPLVFLALHVQRPWWRTFRAAFVPCSLILLVASPVVLMWVSGRGFAMANSVGDHLYNGVIAAKEMRDAEGSFTQEYADLMRGEDGEYRTRTTMRTALQVERGLTFGQTQTVMGQIAWEAILANPFKFAGAALDQGWDQLNLPPEMPWYPRVKDEMIEYEVEMQAVTSASLKWSRELSTTTRRHWTQFSWLFVAAAAGAALLLRRPAAVLALAALPVGMAVVTACVEFAVPRYSAPTGPAQFAVLGGLLAHGLIAAVARVHLLRCARVALAQLVRQCAGWTMTAAAAATRVGRRCARYVAGLRWLPPVVAGGTTLMAAGWMGYELWRLTILEGDKGAPGLRAAQAAVEQWFAGVAPASANLADVRAPAEHLLLWPWLGWARLGLARWLWAGSALLGAWWLCAWSRRSSGLVRPAWRWFAMVLPPALYATGATLGDGYTLLHLLPVTLAGLWLAREARTWRGELIAALLLAVALSRPYATLPLFWLAVLLPRTPRVALMAVAGGLGLTALAAMAQGAGPLVALQQWSALRDAADAARPAWSRGLEWAGFGEPVRWLVWLALGGWTWWARRADPVLLVGVCGAVAALWVHHPWHDHMLMLPTLVALLRVAASASRGGQRWLAGLAWGLFTLTMLTSLAPGGLFTLREPLVRHYLLAQVAAWLASLAFLVGCASTEDRAPALGEPAPAGGPS
ncbi:MAG: glycosyltransferase family 39 protein [Planctomycetota bacterium]